MPPATIHHLNAHRVVQLPVKTLDQIARDHEGQHHRAFVGGIRPVREPALVRFFRRNAERIGIACYVVAVLAGCWFAFQLGRGGL
jgi:hypothetical protein